MSSDLDTVSLHAGGNNYVLFPNQRHWMSFAIWIKNVCLKGGDYEISDIFMIWKEWGLSQVVPLQHYWMYLIRRNNKIYRLGWDMNSFWNFKPF